MAESAVNNGNMPELRQLQQQQHPEAVAVAQTEAATGAAAAVAAASGAHFFEGVEKLLEIWFEPSGPLADMRKVPRSMWDALLKEVRCEIISFTRNDEVDAYVLSESSMFVSRRRWILKTCGTTTPLQCLEPLLRIAAQVAGYLNGVHELFYSRKNFKRPELQQSPHRGFEEEVTLLDSFFTDGRAYCLGSVNRDCWYVYTYSRASAAAALATQTPIGIGAVAKSKATGGGKSGRRLPQLLHKSSSLDGDVSSYGDEEEEEESSRSSSSGNGSGDDEEEEESEDVSVSEDSCDMLLSSDNSNDCGDDSVPADPEPDQTIEILMTELDPAVMELFTKRACADAKEATERSGIHNLLPGMVIDDYLFEPCGYSMNGVGKNNGCYMTIHITPEPAFSYVSFESNVAAANYAELIHRVISTFQPGKFVVTIFANRTSTASSATQQLDHADAFGSWRRQDIQFCRFTSYDLTYAHYCKFPS